MENVSLIAAIGKNYELGKNNDLIWHLSNDLKFFKSITIGKDIVMGSNTFYSLPKLLPGRRHIVLTSKRIDIDNVLVLHTKEELIRYLNEVKREVMIIGGASIYRQLIEYVDKMYLTHIDSVCSDADTYFPIISYNDWDSEILGTNMDNGISYKHVLYKKKNKIRTK